MSGLLELLVANAAVSGVLALLAWTASRHVRRQPLVHGLWLLALVKLVTPPLVEVPVLPDWSEAGLFEPAGPTMIIVEDGTTITSPVSTVRGGTHELIGARSEAAQGEAWTTPVRPDTGPIAPGPVLSAGLLWTALGLGALVVAGTAAARVRRFRRLLDHSTTAPASLQDRASELARRVGLHRAPPVRLLPARVPPMLWPSRRGPTLLLPSELLPALTDEERDSLLVHELAHVRRRDHWVRLLEMAVTVAFWWYPVAWWVRRSLRQAEERCCDEWVLRVMPGSARAYAEGLLKSLDFVAAEPDPLPVGASGAGPVQDLESRLKEIFMATRPLPRLSAPVRLMLAMIAVLGLAMFPIRADSPDPAPEVVPSASDDEAPPPPPRPVVHPGPEGPDTPPDVVPPPPPTSDAGPAVFPVPPLAPVPGSPDARAAMAPRPAPRPIVSPHPAPRTSADAKPPTVAPAPHPVVRPEESSEDAAERWELEARRRDLEAQRAELHRRELEVARERVDRESQAEQERLRAEAERLHAAGEADRAALVEERAQVAARRAALTQEELDIEQALVAEHAERERKLQAAVEKQIALVREGKQEEAEALRREMDELAQARARADLRHEESQIRLQRDRLEIERHARKIEMELAEKMQKAGLREAREQHERQMVLQGEEEALRKRELAARKAAQALRAVELQIAEHEAAGRPAEAEALRADAERIRSEMDATRRGLQEEHLLRASSRLEHQMEGQLQALRRVLAEGAEDGAALEREIKRLQAALDALRSAGE